MVFLKRSKCLPLSRLEKKPPDNISMVHAILQTSLGENRERLKQVEADYYGRGKKAADEINKWLSSIKTIMVASQLSDVNSVARINEIVRITGDPSRRFKADAAELARTMEAYRKVIDCIPYKFRDIEKDLKLIHKYLEMYCLSFYSNDDDVEFDTAREYETKRLEWSKTIQHAIKSITHLVDRFRQSELQLRNFCTASKELGQSTNCFQALFLLIFPEICENLRQAFQGVKAWIEADRNYVTFLSYDLADLEQKKDAFLKVVRDLQQRYSSLQFSLKNLESRCDKLSDELSKLDSKENELTTEEELLIEQSNEMQLEIDRKEWRRNELLRNVHLMHPEVMSEKFNEVCEILREVKAALPVVQRQLFAVRHKLSWISVKREEVSREYKKRDALKAEMEDIEQERIVQEVEYETTLRIFELAKRIYTCKSTPDCVSKIFHEQPVEINNSRLPGHKGLNDPFEVACTLVSHRIEDDWPRLYRKLPFAPFRGRQTIDEDIAELYMIKTPVYEIAKRSLNRWRRFHTRAKLEDLLTALTSIHRADLTKAIDKKLHPEKYKAVDMFAVAEDDESETQIEEYLIKYVRQIERYDKMRAAGKIRAHPVAQ